MPIKSEEYEPETENGLACSLTFSYTAKYPDEPPVVEISDVENITDEDEEKLINHIIEQVSLLFFKILYWCY